MCVNAEPHTTYHVCVCVNVEPHTTYHTCVCQRFFASAALHALQVRVLEGHSRQNSKAGTQAPQMLHLCQFCDAGVRNSKGHKSVEGKKGQSRISGLEATVADLKMSLKAEKEKM